MFERALDTPDISIPTFLYPHDMVPKFAQNYQ